MFRAKNYWGGGLHALNSLLYKIYRVFAINLYYNFKWRKKNKHNLTQLINIVDLDRVEVWNYTLWCLDIRLSESKKSFVKIWNYCCIAAEVEFLWMSNHPTDWLMTERIWLYMDPWITFKLNNPFFKWCPLKDEDKKNILNEIWKKKNETCHWPIIIDDDVWIWTWAKIMSWVHIWQWAVIAAWAVVTKDIPPYAIAWWVPAKVIKYRFSEDKIKKLLKLDYSNISISDLSKVYKQTINSEFDIDFLLAKLQTK